MTYTFFATVSRMKYIDRWALMRNSRQENLSEHSLEVAMIAHALCVIGNTRYGRRLNADRAAVIALYHDASEIITGDMPTPVKYYNAALRDAYKDVEHTAEQTLLRKLPADLRGEYESILCGPGTAPDSSDAGKCASDSGVEVHSLMGINVSGSDAGGNAPDPAVLPGKPDEAAGAGGCAAGESEIYLRRLVKAADKLSALIKCIEERESGNREFRSAEASTLASIEAMAQELPEVGDFMRDFLPAYGRTLDELSGESGE